MPVRVATVRAADVPATQTDFPFYIDLGRVGATALTLADAQSSRWYTDTDLVTEMAREIVSLTEGHGKYASLTSTSKIAIDYDGIRADYAVGATYGRNNVWSDYAFVLHMNEASGNAIDSTANGFDFTDNNTVGSGAGKFGSGSRDFEFSNSEYLSRVDNAAYSLGDDPVTIQSWFNLESVTNVLYYIQQKGWYIAAGVEFNQTVYTGSSPDYLRTEMYDGSFRGSSATAVTINPATWYYGVSRHDTVANRLHTRVNLTDAPSGVMNASRDTDYGYYIGVGHGGTEASKEYYMDGLIDEVRFRKTFLSDDWLTTEYNNQNDEATFWGTWTTFGGGPAAVNARRLFLMMV